MYIFDLWISSRRRAIARAELAEAWKVQRAALPPHARPAFDAKFEAGVERVYREIHPLRILTRLFK